jgi:glycosyltransferase involved in cell wall biosynthesis
VRLEDVTVIVPTRNETRNIAAFLASLPGEVSLIVVDSSEDGTPELVEILRPDHTLLVRCCCNVTQARQVGANRAKTPWLLFTDADVVFSMIISGISSPMSTTTSCTVRSCPTARFRVITGGFQ